MNDPTPRLRMFAGPNGSGKSTLKRVLPEKLLGIYLNPDDIEHEIRSRSFLDLSFYGIGAVADSVLSFFANSDFLKTQHLADAVRRLTYHDGRLSFANLELKSSQIPMWFKRSVLDKAKPNT